MRSGFTVISFTLFRRRAAVAGIAALALLPAAAANAEPPVTIPGGTYVVDDANALGSRTQEVKDAVAKLSKKVKEGGSGVWGAIPMPPNSATSDADIKELVTWILTLKK